jgi:hypothetical protein
MTTTTTRECAAFRCTDHATHGDFCCDHHIRFAGGVCEHQEPHTDPTAQALEYFANGYADKTRTARMSGDKDAAKFFQRAANSFAKALAYWTDGIRPERTAAGNYLLRSQRGPTEAPHLIRKDGDWACTCAAGDQLHWALAMVIGMEAGADGDLTLADARAADPILDGLHLAMDEAEATLDRLERQASYERAQREMDECFA